MTDSIFRRPFFQVAYLVHDFEAEYQRLLSLGLTDACRLYADTVDAAYFDTRSLNGCFTEIHGDPPNHLGRWATIQRARALASGGQSLHDALMRRCR